MVRIYIYMCLYYLFNGFSFYIYIELASAAVRHHMPSKASLCNLLGDLYTKLDNIRAAAIYFWECLKHNPYKISAYTKLCDIAPDCVDFTTAKLPKDIFIDFELSEIHLTKSPHTYLPPRPSPDVSDISFQETSSFVRNQFSVPDIKDDYQEITVDQLRALVRYSPKVIEDEDTLLHTEYERYVFFFSYINSFTYLSCQR